MQEPLSIEIATLYCMSLHRKLSTADIAEKICLVMRPQASNNVKLAKAKVFCNKRITDLRSEERRRVFGMKPCEQYAQLGTAEFAERFLKGLKVSSGDVRSSYIKHLALLRLFIHDCSCDPQNDLFKGFRNCQGYVSGRAHSRGP